MARRKKGRRISGWINFDKPLHMTSTHAVATIKRLFDAQKAGHAGTLDPLATGILPIALGEATKTVPYTVDGEKAYEFTVQWGAETTTDDTEGDITQTSDARPTRSEIENALPDFTGDIEQTPPKFSAIKVDGQRAYDLARDGEQITLAARTVSVALLDVLATPTPDTAEFLAVCGKGTYVRALARDIGRQLGCYGHVTSLRRTRVGPFAVDSAVSLPDLQHLAEDETIDTALLPIETALENLLHIPVFGGDADRLTRGQSIILRGRDAPVLSGKGYATSKGRLLALVEMNRGEIRPVRVFNA